MEVTKTKGLVSIITPCYNGTHIIHRLLDSVLSQDYPRVEMFVVDDGSTDNLVRIMEKYFPKFSECGYSLQYLHQEHQGQSAALNLGLQEISGEFLLWPDCDDFYSNPHAISTFVETFNKLGEDYAVVRSLPHFVDEYTMQTLNWNIKLYYGEWQFDNILSGKDFCIVPITFMIRLSALDLVCPQRNIYIGRRPQNIQMLVPLLYSYKCYTVKKQLSSIVVRNTSDSHSIKSVDETLEDITGLFDIYSHTIIDTVAMPVAMKVMFVKWKTEQLLNVQMTYAARHDRYDIVKTLFRQMRKAQLHIHWKNKILFLLISCAPSFVKRLVQYL